MKSKETLGTHLAGPIGKTQGDDLHSVTIYLEVLLHFGKHSIKKNMYRVFIRQLD